MKSAARHQNTRHRAKGVRVRAPAKHPKCTLTRHRGREDGQQLTKLLSTSFPHHSSTNSTHTFATPGSLVPAVCRTASSSRSLAYFSASTSLSPAISGMRCRVAESLIAAGWEGSVSWRWICRWSRRDSRSAGGDGYAEMSSWSEVNSSILGIAVG